MTPAAGPVVSLDEAKAHLRVEDDECDTLIAAYVDAAAQSLDYLNRAFLTETYALDLETFGTGCLASVPPIELPRPPFQSVTSINATAADGTVTTLDPSDYVALADRSGFASIVPAYGTWWPRTRGDLGSASITYVAGTDTAPSWLRLAILLLVGLYFDNRSEAVPLNLTALPRGVADLVAPYRIRTIA